MPGQKSTSIVMPSLDMSKVIRGSPEGNVRGLSSSSFSRTRGGGGGGTGGGTVGGRRGEDHEPAELFFGWHPNILQIRGTMVDLPHMCLVVEFCEQGDLR